MTKARRAAAAAAGLLVVLALASLASFVYVAGNVLIYDANVYQYGPLAGYSRYWTGVLGIALFVLGPVVYAVATWRRGVVGALTTLAGFGVIGQVLAYISPLSDEPSVRLACCDGVRSFIFLGSWVLGIGWFLIVPPITLVARWVWRRWSLGPDHRP